MGKVEANMDSSIDVQKVLKYIPRVIAALFFGGLVVYQNYIIFHLLQTTLGWENIGDMQIVLAAAVASTVIETYLIAREIGKWMR